MGGDDELSSILEGDYRFAPCHQGVITSTRQCQKFNDVLSLSSYHSHSGQGSRHPRGPNEPQRESGGGWLHDCLAAKMDVDFPHADKPSWKPISKSGPWNVSLTIFICALFSRHSSLLDGLSTSTTTIAHPTCYVRRKMTSR